MPLSTSQVRREYRAYKCNSHDYATISILGRAPVKIAGIHRDAWKALESTLRHAGYPQAHIVGSYNCRVVRDSTRASLHAYRMAIDIDPALNGRTYRREWWRRSRITRAQVAAVTALRTNNGKQIFTSGVTFRHKDPMHFQICCTIADIKTGIAGHTVANHHHHEAHTTTHNSTDKTPGDIKVRLPLLKRGDRGQPTKNLQALLAAHDQHVSLDSDFGSGTERAVKRFQAAHKLTPDGKVGNLTWTALLS